MRDLKIVFLTLIGVYLYQHTTVSDWKFAQAKVRRVITAVLHMLILAFIASPAMADEWLCRSQSSIALDTNTIMSCGVADAKTESQARKDAYTEALSEFHQVCEASDECRGRAIQVKPERTECVAQDSGFRCYRAVTVAISERAKDLKAEIEKRREELSQMESIRTQEDEETAVVNEIRLAKPSASYWNLGLGLQMNSSEFAGVKALQVGYGVNLKRCFFDVVCPGVSLMLGKLVVDSEYIANSLSGSAGLTIRLSDRVFVQGAYGAERISDATTAKTRTFGTGTAGLDVVKVRSVALTVEGGVRINPGQGIKSVGGMAFNFKF